jgi:hypothetical protein
MNTTHDEQMARRAMLERYLSNPTDEAWERFKWEMYAELRSNGAQGHFPITSVHRDDVEGKGFDISNVTDEHMSELASDMEKAYTSEVFWIDLDILAEDIGIPYRADSDETVDAQQ